ncbi:hypothetical protein OAO56_00700 [Amylibacter sp.]|nr:hypothetical protein [Amylibacter sp.]
MNGVHITTPSRWGLTLLFGMLAVRIFVGVDLTDEIQYYYQISGFVGTRSLLSNDLYIQQFIYVVFYPIFKLHELIFNQTGLILYGRFVYSICLLGLYVFADRQLRRAGIAPMVAGLTSFVLCFAPSYHGLFAISYNTVSQIGWCVTAVLLAFRVMAPAHTWALIIVLTGLAHPVSGVAIALIFSIDQISRRQLGAIIRTAGMAILFAAILGALIIWLSGGLENVLRAFRFTSGFSIGSALSDRNTLAYSGLFAILILTAGFAPTLRKSSQVMVYILTALLVIFVLLLLRSHFDNLSKPGWQYAYGRKHLAMWVIIACATLYTVRTCVTADAGIQSILRRLMAVLSLQSLVLAGTSSNGLGQAIGAFAVFVPLVAALFGNTALLPIAPWIMRAPIFCIVLLVTLITICLPYRQKPLYAFDRGVSDVPMFAGLMISQPVLRFADDARKEILPFLPGQSGLLLSRLPGFYPILSVAPKTCMIYNHSLGSDASKRALLKCLSEQSLPFVAYIQPAELNQSDLAILQLLGNLSTKLDLNCETRTLRFSVPPPEVSASTQMTMCQ